MTELNLKIKLQAFDKVSKQFANINKAGGKLGRSFDNNLADLSTVCFLLDNVLKKSSREVSDRV